MYRYYIDVSNSTPAEKQKTESELRIVALMLFPKGEYNVGLLGFDCFTDLENAVESLDLPPSCKVTRLFG